MSAAIQQIVTVGAGGLVELRSPELREGDHAQVTVVVLPTSDGAKKDAAPGNWRRYAGSVSGRDTASGDNESIDADLAAEFGSLSKPGL